MPSLPVPVPFRIPGQPPARQWTKMWAVTALSAKGTLVPADLRRSQQPFS